MTSRTLTAYADDDSAPLTTQTAAASTGSPSTTLNIAGSMSASASKVTEYITGGNKGCEFEAAELNYRRRRYANWHPDSKAKNFMRAAAVFEMLAIAALVSYAVINALEAGNMNEFAIITYPTIDTSAAGVFLVATLVSYMVAAANYAVEGPALAEKRQVALKYPPLTYPVSHVAWLTALWTGLVVIDWIFWHNYDTTYPLQQQLNARILFTARVAVVWETLSNPVHRFSRYFRCRWFAMKDA